MRQAALGLVFCLCPVVVAAAVPVSPGAAADAAALGSRCTVFSWVPDAAAASQRLAVFELLEGEAEVSALDRGSDPERSVLDIRLPAGAASWTPPRGRCLDRPGAYGWMIGTESKGGVLEWSTPLFFRVLEAPSEEEIAAALAVLQRARRPRTGLSTADPEWTGGPPPESAASRPGTSTHDPDLDFDVDDAFKVEQGAAMDSLVVSNLGGSSHRVGIGVADPLRELHVASNASGIASIMLEDTALPTQQWVIQAGDFGINFVDVSQGASSVLSLDPGDGDVGIGDPSPDADLAIQRNSTFSRVNAGDSTFTTSSSRELKENIRPLSLEVLERLLQVPVNTYDWKKEAFGGSEADRVDHVGLIAEDFHSVLGRGSDRQIEGQEVQMVLWLAVQELARKLEAVEGSGGACSPGD